MYGFFNRILRVDLNTQTYAFTPVPDEVLQTTLGGKGLGARLLLDENPPGVDPFAPENLLIFSAGPVTGTRVWSQSRFAAFTKSPATGGFGESYCGGSLAVRLKGCGIDALILKGSLQRLGWLSVTPGGVEFHDAAHLAGADTYAAEDEILRGAPEGSRALVIGPAGENGAVQACIKSDRWRSLGRGGMGAVMGAKKVKGITFAGDLKAEIADPQRLTDFIKQIAAAGKASPATKRYQTFGTPAQVAVTNAAGCFPTRYWRSGTFEGWPRLSADYMQTNFTVEKHGCPNCFLQCTKRATVREGRHAGLEIEGPEYETIYAVGGLNCIDSLEEVAWLNDICDRLGLDTMSAGNLSALAIEAAKRGAIDFDIDYNRPDRIAEFYRLLARREGVGAVFAAGIRHAAAELGLEDIAIHVKGLEPGGFDPRVLKGMGLSYATSARGACHLRGTFYKAELSGEIAPDSASDEKVRLQIDYEDRAALFDCLILCRFFRDFIGWKELGELIAAATGIEENEESLRRRANAVTRMTIAFNLREGIGPEEDRLPERLYREKTAEGASLTAEEMESMVRTYHRIREELDYEPAKAKT